jgi:hypothetical protein
LYALLAVLSGSARGDEPLDAVPELVGLRLRAEVPVVLSAGPGCEGPPVRSPPIARSDVPVLTWPSGSGRWSLTEGSLSGEAADGQASLPTDLPIGVHRVCLEVGERSAAVELEVVETPYTQVSLHELLPDGSERTRGILQRVVGDTAVSTDRWISSDFLRTDTVRDAQGRELKLVRQRNHARSIYQYEVQLLESVPPGEILLLETRGTAEPFALAETGPGELSYTFAHSPNVGQPTRRVEVFVLPEGAELREAPDLGVRERGGRIELFREALIPEGGHLTTSFRYHLEGASLGLPGPVVVQTFPPQGAQDVDPRLQEIRVTFDADMRDGSWAWVQVDPDRYPKATGKPRFIDARTCVLPVKLKKDHEYVLWLNHPKFEGFHDTQGRVAKPYELRFHTR